MAEKDEKTGSASHAEMVAGHLDLPDHMVEHVERHINEFISGESPLVWIQGQCCTGCSISLLNSAHFRPRDLGYEKISLRYQPDLMAGEGALAIGVLDEEAEEEKGKYLLVIEGSIPTAEDGEYCNFGLGRDTMDLMGHEVRNDRTMLDWMNELVPSAEAVIAIGNCAAHGGIPSMNAEVTGATSAVEVVSGIDPEVPIISVTGCPPHPDWMMGTIIEVLLWMSGDKEEPELDDERRLKKFYGMKIHDNCERRAAFAEKRFLTDWNESETDEGRCLLKMGCRGPATHADCPVRLWNMSTSWCVAVNAPCHGCTERGFYQKLPRASL